MKTLYYNNKIMIKLIFNKQIIFFVLVGLKINILIINIRLSKK
jgi:hypothetical protein